MTEGIFDSVSRKTQKLAITLILRKAFFPGRVIRHIRHECARIALLSIAFITPPDGRRVASIDQRKEEAPPLAARAP